MTLCPECESKNVPHYWTLQLNKLKASFGGMCSYEDCNETKDLQFAHRHGFPTDLKGNGRGQPNRLLDVVKNPMNYLLLCKTHHEMYDRSNNKWGKGGGHK